MSSKEALLKKAEAAFACRRKVDRKEEGRERIINERTSLRAKEDTICCVMKKFGNTVFHDNMEEKKPNYCVWPRPQHRLISGLNEESIFF